MRQIYGPDCLDGLPCAVIGPSTRETFVAAFGREPLMANSASAVATVEILAKNLYGRA
jgi:uroporphyrinogen-III synthase